MAELFLTEEDKRAIEEAVRKAELMTSGEIVFALTDASGRYRSATLQGALAGMIPATAAYLALPVPHTIGILLWTELISFVLFYALFARVFRIRRWFISEREMEQRVRDAAFFEFHASGLHRTREANGILIFLSRLEHRVVVLGDRGIHEAMGDARWDELKDTIIEGIRDGRAREAICAAVSSCGEKLAQHFPRRPDDINELPDTVIDRSSG